VTLSEIGTALGTSVGVGELPPEMTNTRITTRPIKETPAKPTRKPISFGSLNLLKDIS
jgi:hypothetical protein